MWFLKVSDVALKVVEVNWFPVDHTLANLITNSIHTWLIKDYRSSGMIKQKLDIGKKYDEYLKLEQKLQQTF